MDETSPTESKTFDLIAIGGATWDAIVSADDTTVLESGGRRFLAYPYGRKVFLEQAFFGFGGGAANVAVSAARLGLKVSFVGAIGTEHIGESILENFANEGVSAKVVKRDPDHRSGTSVVLTAPEGERTALLYNGANAHLKQSDVNWLHCTDTRWIYIASLKGETDALYTKISEIARKNNIKLALNPGTTQIKHGTKGLHVALEDSSTLQLNEEEARELLRQRGEAGESIGDMLTILQDITKGIVVITLGTEGAQACDGTHHYSIDTFPADRINSLGAGDAFGSTFVVAIEKGLPVEQALRYASINAASVVSDYGAEAALLSWPELERRARKNEKYSAKKTKI